MQNNLSEFGQKIQALREGKNMTQDDLARHLGLSAQAVSKWENGAGFPEMSVMPALVAILETDFNYILGYGPPPAAPTNLPQSLDNLPLVHSYGNVGCYSSKQVASIQGSGVSFSDGSTAELSDELIINMGPGEIRLFAGDDVGGFGNFVAQTVKGALKRPKTQTHSGKTQAHAYASSEADQNNPTNFVLDASNAINLDLRGVDCKIVRGEDGRSTCLATGDTSRLGTFNANIVEWDNMRVLHVTAKAKNKHFGLLWVGSRTHTGEGRPQILIEVPFDAGVDAIVNLAGSGSVDSTISHFAKGKVALAGSGEITMRDFGEVELKVGGSGGIHIGDAESAKISLAGSGDVECGNIGDARLQIAGSGDVSVRDTNTLAASIAGSGDIHVARAAHAALSVTGSGDIDLDKIDGGDVTISVTGSGDVTIKSGRANMFKAQGTGAADVNAKGVIATKANLSFSGSSDCVLGHVIESSKEREKSASRIKILGRGPLDGNEN